MNLHMNLHHYLTRLFKLFTLKMWQIFSCSRNYFAIPNFESSKISNYCTTRTESFKKSEKKIHFLSLQQPLDQSEKNKSVLGIENSDWGNHEAMNSLHLEKSLAYEKSSWVWSHCGIEKKLMMLC